MSFKCGDKLMYYAPNENGRGDECYFIEADNGIAKVISLKDKCLKFVDYQCLSATSGYKGTKPELLIKEFSRKSGKTTFILSQAVELHKKNVPCLVISNEMDILYLVDRFKELWQEQYNIDDIGKNGSSCYFVCEPNISNDRIFEICKSYKQAFGIKVLLFDYIRNTNPIGYGDNSGRTISILESITVDLGIDVIATKQMQPT